MLTLGYLWIPLDTFGYLWSAFLTFPHFSFPVVTFGYVSLLYVSIISLPFLIFPYISLPFLTFPYLFSSFLTFPLIGLLSQKLKIKINNDIIPPCTCKVSERSLLKYMYKSPVPSSGISLVAADLAWIMNNKCNRETLLLLSLSISRYCQWRLDDCMHQNKTIWFYMTYIYRN